MSTKIYNGLRLIDGEADLFEVIPKVAKTIRKELGKAAQELVGEELARGAEDKKIRETAKPTDLLWFEVEESWRKRQEAWGPHHRLNAPCVLASSSGGVTEATSSLTGTANIRVTKQH